MYALLAAAFLTSLTAATATGQTVTPTTGAVYGTVSDSSHAVIPGVTVTLAGPTLITKQTVLTDESGVYRFPAVPPGEYGLTFELTGFASDRPPRHSRRYRFHRHGRRRASTGERH